MEASTLNEIMAEVTGALARPACADVIVRPEAVRARALEMARAGYRPTEASLVALERYIQGYGLWLSGDVGTGKTMFFRHLHPLNVRIARSGRVPSVVIFPMVRTLEMGVAALRDWLDDNACNEVVLDDIGAEPVFNHFGGKFDILPYILDKRQESPCRTHATSNLNARAINARYGDERILDRFSEMFVQIPFKGQSMRRSRPNAAIRAAQEAFLRENASTRPDPARKVAATLAESAERPPGLRESAPRLPDEESTSPDARTPQRHVLARPAQSAGNGPQGERPERQ